MQMVPPTASVMHRGRRYAVSKVIEHALDADHFMVSEFNYDTLKYTEVLPTQVKLFDVLIGNYDRHRGNWLIELPADVPLPTSYGKPPAGTKIWMIDHGRGFGVSNGPTMRGKIFGWGTGASELSVALTSNPGFVSALRKLDANAMRTVLGNTQLATDEIEAVVERRQYLLDVADGRSQ